MVEIVERVANFFCGEVFVLRFRLFLTILHFFCKYKHFVAKNNARYAVRLLLLGIIEMRCGNYEK